MVHSTHPSPGRFDDARPGTVLVVEDDPDMQALIGAIVAGRGHRVLQAMDGATALHLAREADLVLLDAVLPGMDGWEICGLLKQRDPGLPVIMVTARTGREDVVRTFDAGADDYIAKPFHSGELLARVDSRLAARRAEEELRLALERYELVARASSEVLWEWDVGRGVLVWSGALTEVFGHPVEPATATIDWWLEQVHPAHRDRVARTLDETLRSGSAGWEQEYRFRRGDGGWAEVVDRGFVVREGGEPVRMIGSIMDISGRKQLEGALRFLSESSAVLADALDAPHMLAAVARVSAGFLGDMSVVVQDTGDGVYRIRAAAHGDRTRQPFLDRNAGELRVTRGSAEHPLARALDAPEPSLLTGPDAALLEGLDVHSLIVVPVSVERDRDAALLFGATGGHRPLVGADLDVARELGRRTTLALEKARLYAGVEAAELRYRLLFEKNPQALLVWDTATHRILAGNGAVLSLYGYSREAFLRLRIEDLRGPEHLPRLEKALTESARTGSWKGETVHRRADGSSFEVEIAADELDFEGQRARLVLVMDVSERVRSARALREAEEQLRQAQKMEAIGQLAGGVAHDFNNLLTAIQGHARLLRAQLEDAEAVADVMEIERAADRAAGLTRQLLAFGRRQVLQPRVLDLNATVRQLERMLRSIVGESNHLSTRLDPELPPVRADPGQVEQVLINLVVNARDALSPGGRLEIATRLETVDAAGAVEGLLCGEHVVLEVSDSGHGMSPEVRERVFEPFFTTKPVGKGTGLGLSTVYGIVRQTGGGVAVRSAPDQGTTFSVFLPAVREPVADRAGTSAAGGGGAMHGAGWRILLVEDEPSVRQLARRVLEREGFDVLEADCGAAALEVAAAAAEPIHLLLTDVVMPGMSGPVLARTLQEQRADVRVLFMSGYAEDDIVDHGVLQEGVEFLGKPFRPRELVARVHAILRRADPLPR